MRQPTLDESNQLFTMIMVGLGGVVGSVISFLFSGAILAALLRLYQGEISLPGDKRVLLIGAAFASFFAAETLSALINFDGSGTWLDIVRNVPFLGFIFIYGRLALSRRSDVLHAAEIGVVTGSLGAFAYAVVETAILGEMRAEGLAGNPGPFALISAVLYGLSVLTVMRREGRMRSFAALAAAAAAGALVLSGMRTLWPMLLIGPVVPLVLLRSRLSGFSLKYAAVFIAGAIVVVGLLGHDVVQRRVQNLMNDYKSITVDENFNNSAGYRLLLWSAGLERAAEKPVFGHGPGRATFSPDDLSPTSAALAHTYSHYHNFALSAVVRSGFVGLLATLFMLLAPVWVGAREERDEIADAGFAMMLTVLMAYVLSGMFNIMLGHDILDALFIYSTIVASYLVLGVRERSSPDAEAPRGSSVT